MQSFAAALLTGLLPVAACVKELEHPLTPSLDYLATLQL
jgi:hypothetical protein